jgi:hypothetical protein
VRPKPNLAGFREAQSRLIQEFGEDLTWFFPVEKSWPPGTPIDPETNEPYDPTIQPLASGFTSAVVKAGVISRPIGGARSALSDTIQVEPIGQVKTETIVLSVDYETWIEEALDKATEVEVHSDRFRVNMTNEDQLGDGPPQRVLVYLRKV